MKCTLKRVVSGIVGGVLGALVLESGVSFGSIKHHMYRYSEIDMPVSLAVGTVRTPEFIAKHEDYFIMIEAEKRLPFADMKCMMGLTSGPADPYNCDKEPLLQADWTVMDDGHIVVQGSNHSSDGGDYTNKALFKFLGRFKGEAGKKYSLEVKFTKDGTPLNVTNPHLIVILVKDR